MESVAFNVVTCRQQWIASLAPESHDVRAQLIWEAAEYFGLTRDQVRDRLEGAVDRLAQEWRTRQVNPADPDSIVRFYNETDTEIFELLEWHATNNIHVRSVMCAELARLAPGTRVLDYGSGIGSDAIIFGRRGFDLTLADISDPLRQFAAWRCRRHGLSVRTIDLKVALPERGAFDVAICFDVLEHLPRPLEAVKILRNALAPGGLLFLHAPYGEDPARPMHLQHADTVSPHMRALCFHNRTDLEARFPADVWGPRVYERVTPSAAKRVGYYLQDTVLPAPVGAALATAYRRMLPRQRASRSAIR